MQNRERKDLSKSYLAQQDIHTQWENDYLNPDVDPFYDAAFARIVESLGPTQGKTILDIGCGYCFHTARLARSDLQITSADFSPVALEHAAQTLERAGIRDRVTLREADATNLPFEDASFDNVLIWGVLMHIPEVEKALAQAVRVLKPGGRLVLMENNRASLDTWLFEPPLNLLKAVLGKRRDHWRRVPLGIENWSASGDGGLMVRRLDMGALERHMQGLGVTLEKRFAGQLTESYTRMPGRGLKRLVHGFNRFYFKHIGAPGPALGNILVFVKQG